jgi:OPA family sugar phosphate sensor protein UhpC-like MFS transporter
VFAATWLSYVGFYFCRTPFSKAKGAIGDEMGWDARTLGNVWAAYLIAYAAGQFLASQMGPRLGPRRNVLLGMALSVAVTLAMGIAPSWQMMAALVAINGIAQATGWSGNVGTMACWFHKHERGRVMGWWSTNFTVGALLSGAVMAWVLDVPAPRRWSFAWLAIGHHVPWRTCFYVGGAVLAAIWINFYVNQRDRPEDVRLAAIDDPVTAIDESKVPDAPTLSRDAWINLLVVAGFYFCAKFIRYGLWSWAAYFLRNKFGQSDSEAALYSLAFDVAGVGGVIATGWLSDRCFASRRGEISLIMMIGMMIATGLLMLLGGTSAGVFVLLLAAVGFTLYGPDSLLTGAGAMDIGSRSLATFAAAMISGFGSTGAAVQELVISRMYDAKGSLAPVFGTLFGSAALATLFCAVLVWRNRKGGKGI